VKPAEILPGAGAPDCPEDLLVDLDIAGGG
jgi:hypothetical protein